jgi:polysaccharide pyruvyl transferase WcaK-like protein
MQTRTENAEIKTMQLAAPRRPIPKGARVLLLGYWGFRNLGDDLMLRATLEYVRELRPDLKLIVSVRDLKSAELIPGICSIGGVGVLSKLRRFREFLRADSIAWIGGTCLYDHMGLRDFSRLHYRVRLARGIGKPFHFVNVGIGTFFTREGARKLEDILQVSESGSFRDVQSLSCAQAATDHPEKFIAGGDLVALLRVPQVLKKRTGIRHIGFSGTREFANDRITVQWLAETLARFVSSGSKIHFFAFHGGDAGSSDHILHRRIAALLPRESYRFEDCQSHDSLLSTLSTMDFHIGMRLHSVMVCDMLGIPGIGLAATTKVRRYLRKANGEDRCVGLGSMIDIESMEACYYGYSQPSAFLEAERLLAIRGLDSVFKGITG